MVFTVIAALNRPTAISPVWKASLEEKVRAQQKWASSRDLSSLCLILQEPMDWSPPDSSVHRILRASILGWVCHIGKGAAFPNTCVLSRSSWHPVTGPCIDSEADTHGLHSGHGWKPRPAPEQPVESQIDCSCISVHFLLLPNYAFPISHRY